MHLIMQFQNLKIYKVYSSLLVEYHFIEMHSLYYCSSIKIFYLPYLNSIMHIIAISLELIYGMIGTWDSSI